MRQSGTSAEEAVAALLRQLGVRTGTSAKRLLGRPDFVNRSQSWCIFVHGCFWHAHTGCRKATVPRHNRDFWIEKFKANKQRDARVLRGLRMQGVRALVVWECQVARHPERTVRRIAGFLGRVGRRRQGDTDSGS